VAAVSERAELSALATSLNDLVDRVGQLSSSLSGAARDDVGQDLFEVERSLMTASRRLSRIVAALPPA
jgi:hypothetical protein